LGFHVLVLNFRFAVRFFGNPKGSGFALEQCSSPFFGYFFWRDKKGRSTASTAAGPPPG
jgi:hypothetical protein